MQKSGFHRFSKFVIDALFFLSIPTTVAIPFFSKYIYEWIGYRSMSYADVFTGILLLSAVGCVYILHNLRGMYRTLVEGNPFVAENAASFGNIAITCIVIAVMYYIKLAMAFTLATLLIAAVFTVGCLFCLTLRDLFRRAAEYKAENDLTI